MKPSATRSSRSSISISSRTSGLGEALVAVEVQDVPEESKPHTIQEIKTLLHLVVPVMGTTILEFLPGFLSVILAGHIDSPYQQEYVDAATISTMLINITSLSIGLGLASALDTLCSQAHGAQQVEKIGIYFQTGMMVLSAILVPIFLINWFTKPILVAIGQNEDVSGLAQTFSRWMLPGIPCVFFYELVRKVLQTQNIVKPLVGFAVAGNIVNFVAAYFLAYHSSLGFKGIAIARTLGYAVMPLLFVPYFIWRPHHLHTWWVGWDFRAAAGYIGLFLRLGVPGMLMFAIEMWAFEILSLLAGVLPNSVEAVSAHAILMNVNVLVWTTFNGLSVAANIRVGNCLGANAPKKARLAALLALGLTLGLAVTFTAFIYGFSGEIPGLFIDDSDTIAIASHVMALWSPITIADGLNAVLQGIYRGTGKQKVAAITNCVAYYLGGIPLGAILAFVCDMDVEGLWLGIGFGIITTALILGYILLRCWRWEQLAHDAQKRTAQ